MTKQIKRLYEFGPFHFYPDDRVLLCDGKNVHMSGRAKDVFGVLFERRGEPVSKGELLHAVWGRQAGDESNLYRAIADINKALRASNGHHEYIETLREYGYRFAATDVREVLAEGEPNQPIPLDRQSGSEDGREHSPISKAELPQLEVPGAQPVPSYDLYRHIVCIIYASLYSVMVVAEVAYELDRYAGLVAVLVPLTFGWSYLTSLLGLSAAERYASREGSAGLAVAVCTFVAAAFILYLGVVGFLPSTPVTQQTVQSSTAQAAYLKAPIFNLLLAVPFLVIPFHFIVAAHSELRAGKHRAVLELLTGSRLGIAPRGAIYLRLWLLILLLLFYMRYSMVAHNSLVGSLKPHPFMNTFILLLLLRLALYYGLGIGCLMWYYRALNEIKRESLIRANQQTAV
jgi:DNA-binding winged helix-turn-helix (wHTH) protein